MLGLQMLRKKIREEMNNLADDLATGVAKDYAEYRQLVGKIEGLAIAERELLDIEKRLTKDEDE